MGMFIFLVGFILFMVSIVMLIINFFKKKPKKKLAIAALVGFVLLVVGPSISPESEKETTNKTSETSKVSESNTSSSVKESSVEKTKESSSSSSEETKESKKKSDFYVLDKIISETSTIGDTTMTADTYNDLAINGFTLEGCITKFGIPAYATSSIEGDSAQEILYPSNEDGYSVGLVFEYDKNGSGFGKWKLTKKYAVETKGIHIPEYSYNR
ncbi:hypothetical protein [Enterococcus sp. AZ102]|uniref:hypothetical protein n=1 Tax=Enterococcus sp. AZ102 TaxID=2774865 RepID=UPI003F22A7F4